jgi:hypothetical protein
LYSDPIRQWLISYLNLFSTNCNFIIEIILLQNRQNLSLNNNTSPNKN